MGNEVIGNSGAVSNPMASAPVTQPVIQPATMPVQSVEKKGSKLWIWLVIIIVLIIGGISYFLIFANVGNDSSSTDIVDNDSDLGSDLPCDLRLDAPDGWHESMNENTLLYIFPFEAGESSSVRRVATIEISVLDITGKSETLEEHTANIVGDLKEKEADENILIDLLEEGERMLGGFEGHMAVHHQVPFDSTLIQVWTLVGNSFYFVTYKGNGDGYEEYLSVAEEVIDSIKIAGDCYS